MQYVQLGNLYLPQTVTMMQGFLLSFISNMIVYPLMSAVKSHLTIISVQSNNHLFM